MQDNTVTYAALEADDVALPRRQRSWQQQPRQRRIMFVADSAERALEARRLTREPNVVVPRARSDGG